MLGSTRELISCVSRPLILGALSSGSSPASFYNFGSTPTWVIAPPPCSAAPGCTVRRWASVWSKPRPSALLLPARGGGEKVAAAPPTPSLWSSGLQQPGGAVQLQRPGVSELPQGLTKFAASSPARSSSLSAAVGRPGVIAATPSDYDSTPTDGGRAERTLKSRRGETCACSSPVGDLWRNWCSPRERYEIPAAADPQLSS